MSNTNATDELPSSAPGVAAWDAPGQGYSVREEGEEYSSSSVSVVSPFAYFFVAWLVLLLLIAAAIILVAANRCNCSYSRSQGKRQRDVEAIQTSAQPYLDPRRKKIINWVGFAVVLTGGIIGVAFSIFSIATCQFVDLDPEIRHLDAFLDGSYSSRTSIAVHSLGLWSADIDSNAGISGCVRNILPRLDWQFDLARASAVIASLFGGQCLLIFVVLASTPAFRVHVRRLAWPFFLTAAFQLMTLSLLGSTYCTERLGDGGCIVGLGGTASVTAALYWMFMAFASFFMPFYHETTVSSDEEQT